MLTQIVYKCQDQNCITLDFPEYIKAQDKIDNLWLQQSLESGDPGVMGFKTKFVSMQVHALAFSGEYSCLRAIEDYNINLWNIEKCGVPVPLDYQSDEEEDQDT